MQASEGVDEIDKSEDSVEEESVETSGTPAIDKPETLTLLNKQNNGTGINLRNDSDSSRSVKGPDSENTSFVDACGVTGDVNISSKKMQASEAVNEIPKSEDSVEERSVEAPVTPAIDKPETPTELNKQKNATVINLRNDNDSSTSVKGSDLEDTSSVGACCVASDVNHTSKKMQISEAVNEIAKSEDSVKEERAEASGTRAIDKPETLTELNKQNNETGINIRNDDDSARSPKGSDLEDTSFVDACSVTGDVNHASKKIQASEVVNEIAKSEDSVEERSIETSGTPAIDKVEIAIQLKEENDERDIKIRNNDVDGDKNKQKFSEHSSEIKSNKCVDNELSENSGNTTKFEDDQFATVDESLPIDCATNRALESSNVEEAPPVDASEGKSDAKHSNKKLDCSDDVNKAAKNQEKEAEVSSSTLENKSTESREIYRELLDAYAALKDYSSHHLLLKNIRYYQLFLKLLSLIIAFTLCIRVIESMYIDLLFLLFTTAVMSSLNIKILFRDLGIQSEDDKTLKSKSDLQVKFVENCCLHNNSLISLLERIKSLLKGKNVNFESRFSLTKFLLLVIIDEVTLLSNSLCLVACKLSDNCENFSIIHNLLIFTLVISVTEYLIKRERYHGRQEEIDLEESFKVLENLCSEQLKSSQTVETYAEENEKCKKFDTANDILENQTKIGFVDKIPAHQKETDAGSIQESEALPSAKSLEEDLNEMYECISDDVREQISQDDSNTSLNSEDKTFEGNNLSVTQDGKKLCRTSSSSTSDGVICKIMKFVEKLTAYIFRDSFTDFYKLNEAERANESDSTANLHNFEEKFRCATDGVPQEERILIEDDTEKQTYFINSSVGGEKAAELFGPPTVNISTTKNNGENSTCSISCYEAENEALCDRESISELCGTRALINEELEMRKSSRVDESAEQNYQRDSSNEKEGNMQVSTVCFDSFESDGTSNEHNIFSLTQDEKIILDNIPEILKEIRKLEETEISTDDETSDQILQCDSSDKMYTVGKNFLSSLLSVLRQRLYQLIFSPRMHENDGVNNKQIENEQGSENKSTESERLCCSSDEVKDTIDHDPETQSFQDDPVGNHELQNNELKEKKDLFDHEPEAQNNQSGLNNEKNKYREHSQNLTSNTDSSKIKAVVDMNTTNEDELSNTFDSSNNRDDGETDGNLEVSTNLISYDFRTQEFGHQSAFEVKNTDEDSTSPETSPHSFTDIKHEVADRQDLNMHIRKEFSAEMASTDTANEAKKGLKCVPKVDRKNETYTQKYQNEPNLGGSSIEDILNSTNYKECMPEFENHDVHDKKIEKQNLKENSVSEDGCHCSYQKKKSTDISGDVCDGEVPKCGKRESHINETSPFMNKNEVESSFNEEISYKLTKNEEAPKESTSSSNFPVGNIVSKKNHCSQQIICMEAELRKNDIKLSQGKFKLDMQLDENADCSFSYSYVQLITQEKFVSKYKFEGSKSKRE